MPKKILIAVAAFTLLAASFVHAESIPLRGVIEGFYGQPWTHAQRLDLIDFCARHQFNAYIYAPKDDPFHRSKWREPYPDEQLAQLSELIRAANRANVEFVFAVSPGLDLDYSDGDLEAMIEKLDAIRSLGCRRFAIFFDDIDDHNGEAQAGFLNRIEKSFIAPRGLEHLITVPTEYFRLDMIDEEGSIKKYTREFSSALDQNVLVLYTGDGVVVPELTDEQLRAANQIYGRELGVWWNYPVNDYMTEKLALGPMQNLPSRLPAIFFNPMSAFEMSKIALATGAEYALDPKNYEPQKAWQRAIEDQFGGLAREMMIFASSSQLLKNNWADTGHVDAPLEKKMLKAVRKLKKNLPPKILSECKDQLDRLEKEIAAADE